jgi:hypothetical protein
LLSSPFPPDRWLDIRCIAVGRSGTGTSRLPQRDRRAWNYRSWVWMSQPPERLWWDHNAHCNRWFRDDRAATEMPDWPPMDARRLVPGCRDRVPSRPMDTGRCCRAGRVRPAGGRDSARGRAAAVTTLARTPTGESAVCLLHLRGGSSAEQLGAPVREALPLHRFLALTPALLVLSLSKSSSSQTPKTTASACSLRDDHLDTRRQLASARPSATRRRRVPASLSGRPRPATRGPSCNAGPTESA